MPNILIINGHQPYPFSEGRLNRSYVDRAKSFFEARGDRVRVTEVAKGYDIEAEVENHQWADVVFVQFPVNWMGTPWSLKKYQDEVFTAGMDGRLCQGDGRTAEHPTANYGTGGALEGTKYMLSVTFNAPKEAFDDQAEWFFRGASVDDLLFPFHQNMRFFGVDQLPTFAAFDVMKNPEIEADFERFDTHLQQAL